MIEITPRIVLGDDEVEFTFVRASGPGGQNVNKVSSAVQLRFNIDASPSLSGMVKERLKRLAGRKVTSEGVLVIAAQRFRSQDLNRADALERLTALIAEAAVLPVLRRPTRPTLGSKHRRLDAKERRSGVKSLRRRPDED